MGGSSKQVIGYKYRSGLMVAIGNRLEKLIDINPDNRGWILNDPNRPRTNDFIFVNLPNLFGGDKGEGGWVGMIDVHLGANDQAQNEYLAANDSEIVSAFPNFSYLVYRGVDINGINYSGSTSRGFNLVSMSGMLKEVLYFVKRIHVKNNGDEQWHDTKAEINTVLRSGGSKANPQYTGSVSRTGVIFNESQQDDDDNYSWLGSGGNPDAPNDLGSVAAGHRQYPPYDTDFPSGNGTVLFTSTIESAGKIKVTGRFIVSAARFIATPFEGDPISFRTWKNPSSPSDVNDYFYEAWFDLTSKKTFGVSIRFSGEVEKPLFKELDCSMINNYLYGPYDVGDKVDSKGTDINPIHKIREILTDDTAMNKPESDVNNDNFIAAANRIWDEGLGISWAIQEKSCKDAIDELLYHIEAGIRVNRQTGQYEVILFRDDLLDLDNAMQFNESNIKDFSREIAKQDDLVNVLNVKYYDRDAIKDSSFSVYENGSILNNGGQEIAEDVDFPYFMSMRNAQIVANWKLKQLSTPTWKGSFTTGKYEARRLNKYDVIKLSWSKAGFVEMPVRVMKISLGDGIDNTVTIDWIEVIPYSSLNLTTIGIDPTNPRPSLPLPNINFGFEMPYYEAVQNFGQTQVNLELSENPDLGYLQVSARKPQNNSINALLYSSVTGIYDRTAIVNYCPSVVLDQNIGYLDTSFAVKNIDSIASAEIGSCVAVDQEIMVYMAYNPTTKILTVKRGALDTVPQNHLSGAYAWFYDKYPNYDSTQYVDGENVAYNILTTTPSGIFELDESIGKSIQMNARAIRPYPPANVKINGEYYPVEITTDAAFTWVNRNRTQQTGGSVLGWTDAGVTIESGTQTWITIKELDVDSNTLVTHDIDVSTVNTYTFSSLSANSATKFLEVKLKTLRDGYDSYQSFNHKFKFTAYFSAPYNLTVEFKND